MAITNLTNTTWNIPAGWTATAGYGIFSISFKLNGVVDYIGLDVGYNGYLDNPNIANFILASTKYGTGTSLTPSNSFTITITGGTDATNIKLISWLEANGTLVIDESSINGKDYLFQDITWNSWYKTNQNWRENFNNFKNALAPYFELNYSVESGLLITETPFSFDASNKIMIQHPKTTLTVKRTGVYSVVSAWDEDNEKVYISFGDEELKTYKESAGFSWHVNQIGVGMSRFDLYLYDSNRVYIASDFENLIESSPSGKNNPSELKYLNKSGTGLGADMTYCAADNFSFKKDGNTYNMQGWTTMHQFNDKNLTKTERVLNEETGKYPEQTYGYNIKGIETKQFNLGLYPIRIVWSNWIEHKDQDFYSNSDFDSGFHRPELSCLPNEKLICYNRPGNLYKVNIKRTLSEKNIKHDKKTFTNFIFNYDVSFEKEYDHLPVICKDYFGNTLTESEKKYFLSIAKEGSINVKKNETRSVLDGNCVGYTKLYDKDWISEQTISVDFKNIKIPQLVTMYGYSPSFLRLDDVLFWDGIDNGADYKAIFGSYIDGDSTEYIFYTDPMKDKNYGSYHYPYQPFVVDAQRTKTPVYLKKGSYTSTHYIDDSIYRITEWSLAYKLNPELGQSDSLILNSANPSSQTNQTYAFWRTPGNNAGTDYNICGSLTQILYEQSGRSIEHTSPWMYRNNDWGWSDDDSVKSEYNDSIAVVLWSPYIDNEPIFNKKTITITPQRTGSDTWYLTIANPFNEDLSITCSLKDSTKTITSTLKANEQSTVTGFINGIWEINYINPETNESQIEIVELK